MTVACTHRHSVYTHLVLNARVFPLGVLPDRDDVDVVVLHTQDKAGVTYCML